MLFLGAVAARSRYWVPVQPSVRISSSAYAPKRGIASRILNQSQLAITKKDLRGLVRRREMVRLLALPGVFLVVAFLSSTTSGGFSFFDYFGTFIVAYTALYFSMSSVGAEGKSIMNLYQAPVLTKDFVIGKAAPPIVFGSGFGIAFYSVIALMGSKALTAVAPLFLVLSVGLAIEMSLVGLLIGMRFPNFSESPRAAFVSQTAGLIALPSAVLIGGISLSPILVTSMLNLGYLAMVEGFVASITAIGFVCYLVYRLAFRQANKLLSQIPI